MVARGDYGPVLILRGDHKGIVGYYDDDEGGRAVVYLREPFESDYVLIPRADLEAVEATSLQLERWKRAYPWLVKYQYAAQCDACDAKAICDGFHGDYASLFTSEEARPIHIGTKVTDPTHYIRHQVKIYEPEEASRPFRHQEPLARNGARHQSGA